MSREQDSEDFEDLTEWLATNDAKTRAVRSTRLRELLDILPVPSNGLIFLGGEESAICFDEIRRCYVDGSNLAVVLLCLAYVERELAAQLYAAGWEDAKKARLGAVLEKAHDGGMLSALEWRKYRELSDLRNSHAHFRAPGSPTSLMSRTIKEENREGEVLAKDARRAMLAMSKMMNRQSG